MVNKKRFFNENGATLITVAVLIPVFILIAGIVTDIGGAMMAKEELCKACLIAAEESTKSIDIIKAQHEGVNHLTNDFADTIIDYFYRNISERENFKVIFLDYKVYDSLENPKYIEVVSRGSYSTGFLKLINIDSININADAIGRLKRLD